MEEFQYRCPYCCALISALIEPSGGSFDYEEDCEVCCRPIRLRFRVRISAAGEVRVQSFRASTLDDL